MITDTIKNRRNYFGISDSIERALLFLSGTDFSEIAPGKYELNGNEIFYIVDQYQTVKPNEKDLEAHDKYIDVQFIVAGTESIGYSQYSQHEVTSPYSEETDLKFFKGKEDYIQLSKGEFAIFFPNDLHKPGITLGKVSSVKKVVVKLAV